MIPAPVPLQPPRGINLLGMQASFRCLLVSTAFSPSAHARPCRAVPIPTTAQTRRQGTVGRSRQLVAELV